jgi:hypothetical protein
MGRFRIAGNAAIFFPFAIDQVAGDAPPGTPPDHIQAARTFSVSEGVSYTINADWAVDSRISQRWTGQTEMNGVKLAGTSGRSFSSSYGVQYTPKGEFRWGASYDTSFPFYAYAVNTAYAPAVSLSMIYTGVGL